MKNFCFALFVLSTASLFSQRNEVGILLGTANLISDIGSNDYIQSPFLKDNNGGSDVQFAVSGIYKRNFNSRFGVRGQLTYAEVAGYDLSTNDKFKKQRGASYDNTILEFATLAEYNFFDFNHETKTAFTPYIFTGIAFFSHKNKSYLFEDPVNAKVSEKYNFGFSVPFGVGVKLKTNYRWIVALETGFRSTTQDDIDYSNAEEDEVMVANGAGITQEDALDLLTIGQTENNDWYAFSGLKITYAFGKRKCYRTDVKIYKTKKSTLRKYRRQSSKALERDDRNYEKKQKEILDIKKKQQKDYIKQEEENTEPTQELEYIERE